MPRAFLVIGLGYGDEGKGSLVDHLVRKHGIRQVVRFNGGAQARHHVVAAETVHGFSQFGAGTLAGARTVLSRFMLFEPLAFCREAESLTKIGIADPFSRVTVCADAPIILPANILTNRILEIERGEGRHGSCGMGIGLTQADVEAFGQDALYVGDLAHPDVLRDKVHFLWQRRIEAVRDIQSEATLELREQLAQFDIDDLLAFYEEFAGYVRIAQEEDICRLLRSEDTIFEGAQGVLLDQHCGFFPHVTRSNTTFANAERLLEEAEFSGDRVRIGLLRGYGTRHGAGPFPTETRALYVAPCHNAINPWQGPFRTGWFDGVAARYALKSVGGVDLLGLTNLDRLVGIGPLQAAATYQNQQDFPGGEIPPISSDLPVLSARTSKLLDAAPDYVQISPVMSGESCALFRYADTLAEIIGQKVDLVSACAEHHKLYRKSAP